MAVEDLDRRGQLRRDHGQVAGGRAQDLGHRQRRAGEGPQLVLDDRRGLLEERARLHERRPQGTGAGAQGAEGRTELPAQLVDLRQRGVRGV
jgi:hypothetical protein